LQVQWLLPWIFPLMIELRAEVTEAGAEDVAKPFLAVEVGLLEVEEGQVLLMVEGLVMVEELVLFVEAHLMSTLARHLMLLPRQAQKSWMLIHVLEILI